MTLAWLPTLNACLNGTSAVLLVLGYRFIRRQQVPAHRLCMSAAFAASTLFLVSYLTYHARAGLMRFTGQGWIRPIYFVILVSHTVLAIVIVPLVLRTLFLAVRGRFPQHRRLARWTLPLWLYVSITGVIVYLLLYQMPSAWACPACKEALFDPSELPQRLGAARGYAVSIALMLGMPLVLIGGIIASILRHRRRD